MKTTQRHFLILLATWLGIGGLAWAGGMPGPAVFGDFNDDGVPDVALAAPEYDTGNLEDAGSQVVNHKSNPRAYELLAELAVKPRTSYLARLRNPNPALEEASA